MKIFMYPNLDKANSQRVTEQACGILASEQAQIFMDNAYSDTFGKLYGIEYLSAQECAQQCDVMIVTGGDGTILRCSALASKFDKPILGINCGTLGFMASLESSDIEKLRLLTRGDYTVTGRMMLDVTVKHADGEIISAQALNDAVMIKGDDCKIADFEVMKSGSVVSSLRADGVIFSTATGATAYSLSAGGPIIEPDMECIEFSQICAHSLFSRAIVFSPDSELSVLSHCGKDAHVTLTVDGNVLARLTQHDLVQISRSPLTTKIIDLTGGSFFPSVNLKLMTPLK